MSEPQQQHVFRIPGGRDKGTPVTEASDASVKYWAERIAKSLDTGESRNPSYDKKLLQALHARQAVGAPRPANTQQRAQSQAMARVSTADIEALSGSFDDPSKAMAMLKKAAEIAHLITPQTSCGVLPIGCAISSSFVFVDAPKETYGIPNDQSDKRGLDKTALERIASAAGLSWDPLLCCRLDDGSDPHYAHYRAVGYVRNFDGTTRTLKGEVEMDLREGSEVERETSARAAKKDPPQPNTELALMRKFILRHAESKAMNRVIRRLGVRTQYQRAELEKPFAVTKIVFTGQTNDPDIKRLFAEKTFEAFHGAKPALFAQTPYQTPHHASHAPPPVGGTVVDARDAELDDDAYGADDEDYSYEDELARDPDNAGETRTPAAAGDLKT